MFGTEGLPNLLCKHASTSSVWNFYHWVKEVPLSKTSQATRSKEKQPFSQANSLPTNFIYPATWNLSESPATCKQLSGLCQKTLPEPNLCLKFCRQPMRVLLYEGSQTNLATCNLFPEAMVSFIMSATPPLLEPLLNPWRCAPSRFKTNVCHSLLPEKEKKIEDWAKLQKLEISYRWNLRPLPGSYSQRGFVFAQNGLWNNVRWLSS